MTLFNLQLEDKIYTIDLYPELRVAIARHLLGLYNIYCSEVCEISFEDWLALVESAPHPLEDIKNESALIFNGLKFCRWAWGIKVDKLEIEIKLGWIKLSWS